MSTDYDGWEIGTDLLAGNCDDAGSADTYADALRAALESRFPGADINIAYLLNVTGSTLHQLITYAYPPVDVITRHRAEEYAHEFDGDVERRQRDRRGR